MTPDLFYLCDTARYIENPLYVYRDNPQSIMNRAALSDKLPPIRNRYFFIADVLLMPLAVGISFLLRLDIPGMRPYTRTILIFAVLAALVKPVIFYLFGLYRRYWRYASANELVNVALATLTGTAVVTLAMYSIASLV